MRYLIAPNAFKGTIAAEDAAQIILEELGKESNQECIIQPVADGGDGTWGLLIESLGLEKITIPTLNSIGLPIQGFMGWDSSTKRAFLDVSTASGLGMLEEFQKDPLRPLLVLNRMAGDLSTPVINSTNSKDRTAKHFDALVGELSGVPTSLDRSVLSRKTEAVEAHR
jgi:hypothetical protein